MFPLYLDENAQDTVLTRLLRGDGIDCLLSNEAGNAGLSDEGQLTFAQTAGRTLVTFDRGDFQRIHGHWMRRGQSHAGILIVTRADMPAGAIHRAIMALQRERTAEQMKEAILFLSPPAPEEQP